jgi:nucleotide-binding universal stress UspA family protein
MFVLSGRRNYEVNMSSILEKPGGPASFEIRQILAPTDLSEESQKVLNYAAELAQHFGSKLTILHIYETSSVTGDKADTEGAGKFREQDEVSKKRLLSIWEEVRAKQITCDTIFEWGRPNELIVTAAKNLQTDLIVLSTHDYHWLRHLFWGSDAENILHHAPCPVLIVHEQ